MTLLLPRGMAASQFYDPWEEQFKPGVIAGSGREWYARHCRPQVPLRRDPLVGRFEVVDQASADLLYGRKIIGSIGYAATDPSVHLRNFFLQNDGTGWDTLGIAPGAKGTISHGVIDGCNLWSRSDVPTSEAHSRNLIGGGYDRAESYNRTAEVAVKYMQLLRAGTDSIEYLDSATYEYIYIHSPFVWRWMSPVPYESDVHPHSDASQGIKGSFSITRSFIDHTPQGANIVSAIELNPSYPMDGVLISENYINGGGFTFNIVGYTDPGEYQPTNIVITDNLLGRDHSSTRGIWRIGSRPSGGTGAWDFSNIGSVIRVNNRYADTGEPVPLTNASF